MKKTHQQAFGMVAAGILAYSPGVDASSCQVPSGSNWINERGSEMSLNIDADGNVAGTYTTAVGCGAGTPRDVSGFCNGHAITFSVNWQECVSVTAWSGTYEAGKIESLWHLVLAAQPDWNSIVAGTDVFIRQ